MTLICFAWKMCLMAVAITWSPSSPDSCEFTHHGGASAGGAPLRPESHHSVHGRLSASRQRLLHFFFSSFSIEVRQPAKKWASDKLTDGGTNLWPCARVLFFFFFFPDVPHPLLIITMCNPIKTSDHIHKKVFSLWGTFQDENAQQLLQSQLHLTSRKLLNTQQL